MSYRRGDAGFVDFLSKDMFTGETRLNNKPLVDYLGSMMKEASVNGAAGGGVALAERPDLTSVLPTIDVPTLFLFGIEDSLTPASLAQSMAEKVSDSTVVVIEDASHAAILEQPEKSNAAIIEWLASVDSGS